MDQNELLQNIGRLYTDLMKAHNIIQQLQAQVQERNTVIDTLTDELANLKAKLEDDRPDQD